MTDRYDPAPRGRPARCGPVEDGAGTARVARRPELAGAIGTRRTGGLDNQPGRPPHRVVSAGRAGCRPGPRVGPPGMTRRARPVRRVRPQADPVAGIRMRPSSPGDDVRLQLGFAAARDTPRARHPRARRPANDPHSAGQGARRDREHLGPCDSAGRSPTGDRGIGRRRQFPFMSAASYAEVPTDLNRSHNPSLPRPIPTRCGSPQLDREGSRWPRRGRRLPQRQSIRHSARCRRRSGSPTGASTSATRPIRCPRRRTSVGLLSQAKSQGAKYIVIQNVSRPRPRWLGHQGPATRHEDRLPQLVRRTSCSSRPPARRTPGHILIQPFAPRRPTNGQQGGRGLSQGEGSSLADKGVHYTQGSYTMAVMVGASSRRSRTAAT